MRRITIFLALALLVGVSCSKDQDLLDAVLADEATENSDNSNNGGDNDLPNSGGSNNPDLPSTGDVEPGFDDNLVINSTPCDFTLQDVQSNQELSIDCQIDLQGQSVQLPSNVTLLYSGGEIINGTLNFDGGKIDGDLLNASLEISGTAELVSPNFKFYPSRWAIQQGNIPFEDAYINHLNFQKSVDLVKSLGGTVFEIGKLDAFFSSERQNTAVLELPSDFHLKMSSDTFLRIAHPPAKDFTSWMFRLRNVNNTIVSGGFLDGQRDVHGPDERGTGVLVWITSGIDVLIENVTIYNASHSGLTINSFRFADDPLYEPSRNVVVRGCVLDSNRANNLSITDGRDIIVENCKLYRAGISTNVADGIAPRIGIVIEPVTGQTVDGVIVRNNLVKEDAGKSSILAALGNNFTFSGNEADNMVGWTSASNVKVINNPALRGGVIAGFNGSYARSQSMGNVVSGNTLLGGSIYATNDDVIIENNLLRDSKMYLTDLENAQIINNTIENADQDAFGIYSRGFLNEVLIQDNNVLMSNGRAFKFESLNQESSQANFTVTLIGNVFESTGTSILQKLNGFNLSENEFRSSGLAISNVTNVNFIDNTINCEDEACLRIQKFTSSSLVNISGNTIINSNDTYLGGYGIRFNGVGSSFSGGNSQISVNGNNISVTGGNHAIHSEDFDGLNISNNSIQAADLPSIYFRGNNSEITGNQILSGNPEIDASGSNNVVQNNS